MTTSQANPSLIRLTRARPDPLQFAGVVDLLARHRPFSDYPFGLLVQRVKRQLQQHAAVVGYRGDVPISYMGGVRVREEEAIRWREMKEQHHLEADWQSGNAMVITIVVADHPRLLRPMARSFASFYPGMRGYWKRVYTDGRPDSWRPPYGSRRTH